MSWKHGAAENGRDLLLSGLWCHQSHKSPIAGYLFMCIYMLLQLFGLGAGQTGMLAKS